MDDLFRALVAADPYRWIAPAPIRRLSARETGRLLRRLVSLAPRALAIQPARGLAQATDLIEAADLDRPLGLVPDVPPVAGRHPVVLAHGPSLAGAAASIAQHRQRLYVIAPLRTALRLAEMGVVPDVVTLADVSPYAHATTEAAWRGAPEAARRALGEGATLVTEALAPRALTAPFRRACVFDDGLGWLPAPSLLPWWGSALVPSLALALRLGGGAVAIAGVDMMAARGRRSMAWSGEPACVAPAMEVALALLEAIAAALPGRLVDLSPHSIAKRGFACEPIERFVDRAVPPGEGAARMPATAASAIVEPMRRRAATLEPVIRRMAATAARVCELVDRERSGPELQALVEEMEDDWRVEPSHAAVLTLAQPSYLASIQQLRAAGIASQDRAAAARMKARLVGPEVAAIEATYRQWLSRFERTGASAAA